MTIEERIERVEKFFLRSFLTTEELDVVNEEKVGLAIAFAEFDQGIVLNPIDELVNENLT